MQIELTHPDRTGEQGADSQDDPRTANSRLPRRTLIRRVDRVSDFRPWLIRAAWTAAIRLLETRSGAEMRGDQPALLRRFFRRQRFLRNEIRTETGARNLFRAEFAEQLGRLRLGRKRVSVLDTFGDP